MRRALFGISLCLASVLAGAPVASAASGDSPISVLGSTSLKVTGKKDADTAEGKFTLLNAGETDVTIAIGLQATSSEVVKVESWTPEDLPAGKAKKVTIEFSGLSDITEAVTGQLVITGGKEPIAQALEVVPPPPSKGWAAILIFGSLAATVLAVAFVIGAMKDKRSRLLNKAPNPKWSFSSWATTLTAAGAVFGTVLGKATFPPIPTQITQAELVNLNIFFGLLLLVGPFLFEALRGYNPDEAEAGRTGNNLTVLIACGFTVWAVVGQLGAFGLLGWELLAGNDWAPVVAVVAVVFALFALWYFFTSTHELVVRDWKKEEEDAKKAAEEAAKKAQCPPKPVVPITSWKLL